MGLRFRKSVKIAPGVKVNFNKKSVGLTVGGKGARYTVNSSGRKTASVGIPGTGLSYSTSSTSKKTKKSNNTIASTAMERTSEATAIEVPKVPLSSKTWFTVLWLILFFPFGLYLMWSHKKFSKTARIIITVVIVIFAILSAL